MGKLEPSEWPEVSKLCAGFLPPARADCRSMLNTAGELARRSREPLPPSDLDLPSRRTISTPWPLALPSFPLLNPTTSVRRCRHPQPNTAPASPPLPPPPHATSGPRNHFTTYLEAPPLEPLARLPPACAHSIHRRTAAVAEFARPRRPGGRVGPLLAHPPAHPHPRAVIIIAKLAVVDPHVAAVPHKSQHVLPVGQMRWHPQAAPVRRAPPVFRAVAAEFGRARLAPKLPRRPAAIVKGRAGVVELGGGCPQGHQRPADKAAVVVVAAVPDVKAGTAGGGGDGGVGKKMLPWARATARILDNGGGKAERPTGGEARGGGGNRTRRVHARVHEVTRTGSKRWITGRHRQKIRQPIKLPAERH